MLKTYSLKHDKREDIENLIMAYNEILNSILEDIWTSVEWKQAKIQGKKQFRLIPAYRKDNLIKRELRDKYLKNWTYAAHWVDSALKTAFSIMDSGKRTMLREIEREHVLKQNDYL